MGLTLTETVCDEKIVITAEAEAKSPFEEKIAARKTIVYETLVDPEVIKITAENLKDQIFAKYGLIRTKPEEVAVTSLDKYYEPIIKIAGKYTVDYYRKRVWNIKVSDDSSEVILGIEKFKPKQTADWAGQTCMSIELKGEERVKKELRASLALDRDGRDISIKNLQAAPSEKNPEKILAKSGTQEVPAETDLSILRTRIFKRPSDASWIENELFEVDERLVIYVPKFKVTLKHAKTGKEKTLTFDGINGKLIPREYATVP
jgi:hypothetical protein